jgi:hypothetical protein
MIAVLWGAACVSQAPVDDWLLCGDCLGGERAAAAAVGESGVPYLGRALQGLAPEQRENLRRQFEQSYRQIVLYGAGGPAPAVSETAYVDELLANADATYRKRAATALVDISARSRSGAAAAEPYLREVLRDHASGRSRLRDDVVRSVEAALASSSYDAFTGTLSDTSVAFLDTVTVLRPGGSPPWDTNVVGVTLAGAPFPGVLGAGRWADSIRFVAVGRPGQYVLVLRNAGPGGRSERTVLNITAMPYVPSDPSTAPSVPVSASGAQRFLVLHSGAPADHFRLELLGPTRVALRVEWRPLGLADSVGAGGVPAPDLAVLPCGGGAPMPSQPSAAGDFPLDLLVGDTAGLPVAPVPAVQLSWGPMPAGCWLARVEGVDLDAVARLLVRAVP